MIDVMRRPKGTGGRIRTCMSTSSELAVLPLNDSSECAPRRAGKPSCPFSPGRTLDPSSHLSTGISYGPASKVRPRARAKEPGLWTWRESNPRRRRLRGGRSTAELQVRDCARSARAGQGEDSRGLEPPLRCLKDSRSTIELRVRRRETLRWPARASRAAVLNESVAFAALCLVASHRESGSDSDACQSI